MHALTYGIAAEILLLVFVANAIIITLNIPYGLWY
jgi:hypothetical protein